MTKRRVWPTIPEPANTIESLHASVSATKEVCEILTAQRGTPVVMQTMTGRNTLSNLSAAVTWADLLELGVIKPEQVPKV